MILQILPGLLLAASLTGLAVWLGPMAGAFLLQLQGIPIAEKPPNFGITLCVLLGMLAANTIGTHKRFAPGLDFGVKKILRLGIVLVGIKLSLFDVMKLGAYGIPMVALLIASAILFTIWLARRVGVSDRLGTLAAASTSICGVTAALAVAPQIEAEEKEVAYTVANVTLFGAIGMLIYPYLAHALFAATPAAAGMFLGSAIHDTSQVVGAAFSYQEIYHEEAALKAATVMKLTRNLFLLAVVPVLVFYFAKRNGGSSKKVSLGKLFPTFVLGFLAMAALRTVIDAGFAGDATQWKWLVAALGDTGGHWALGIAMASLGLSTKFRSLRELGWKPLAVGGGAALFVSGVGLALAATARWFSER